MRVSLFAGLAEIAQNAVAKCPEHYEEPNEDDCVCPQRDLVSPAGQDGRVRYVTWKPCWVGDWRWVLARCERWVVFRTPANRKK